MKPVIGIILREDLDIPKYFLLNKEVAKSITKFDGMPVGFYANNEDMQQMINMCDGFIMQGGDFFTDFDFKLIKKLKEIDKPLLGICLGMQEMGLLPNGRVEDIDNHKSTLKYVHDVNIIKGTKLFNILKKDKIVVNSRHKDYLSLTNLKISGVSTDGIIEAIEDDTKSFFIGVQWHPESLMDDTNSKLLFESFIKACKGENI